MVFSWFFHKFIIPLTQFLLFIFILLIVFIAFIVIIAFIEFFVSIEFIVCSFIHLMALKLIAQLIFITSDRKFTFKFLLFIIIILMDFTKCVRRFLFIAKMAYSLLLIKFVFTYLMVFILH